MRLQLALALTAVLGADAYSFGSRVRTQAPAITNVTTHNASTLVPTIPIATSTQDPSIPRSTIAIPIATVSPGLGSTDGSNGQTIAGLPSAGSAVTCTFRYSLPDASNVPDELVKMAKASSDGSNANANATSTNIPTLPASSSTGSSFTDVNSPTAGSVHRELTEVGDEPSSATPARPTQPAGPSDTTVTTEPVPTTTKPSRTTTKPTRTTTAPPTTSTPIEGSRGGIASSSDGSNAGAGTQPSAGPSSSPSHHANTNTNGSTTSWNSTTTDNAASTTVSGTGTFSCDAKFYGAWKRLGLKCGGLELDVATAVGQASCVIYSGVVNSIKDLCMSVCRFPKCSDGVWDYSADDGFTSSIYKNLDLVSLLGAVGVNNIDVTASKTLSKLNFQAAKQCPYQADSSFASCQCQNLLPYNKRGANSPSQAQYQPPVDKGLGDFNHWADGTSKATIDKVGIASASVGTSAAVVSVAVGGVMSAAGGIMGTGGGVAAGVSGAASLGVAMATVDLCQFGVMVNQLNLDSSPRVLQELGKKMSVSVFSFLPFGRTKSNSTQSARRLEELSTDNNQVQGMERYAKVLGLETDKMFLVTLAGVVLLTVAPYVACAILVLCAYPFVKDIRAFTTLWSDRAVGAMMTVLILSEYVIGVTGTFQICYAYKHRVMDASFYAAILSLLMLSVGTVFYGYLAISKHEDELRDIGTKEHLDKPVNIRYGALYNEYTFEGRYFFAPKLLLSLFSGVITGIAFLPGNWQVALLIALHIVFLFYLEVKQPYPQAFVHKTSSFMILIKISAFLLTFFLISSTAFQKNLPDDLRKGMGFAIIGLQGMVLFCLMIRQIYIFYVTWKLRQQGGDDDSERSHRKDSEQFQPFGSRQSRQSGVAMLGGQPNSSAAYGEQTISLQQPQYGHPQQQQQQQQPVQVSQDQYAAQYDQHQYQQQYQPQYQQQYQQQAPTNPLQRRTQSYVVHDAKPHGEVDL